MKKVFIRSTLEDGSVECSWYNIKGKRYRHETINIKYKDLSAKQTDDEYGFMGYAKLKDFLIVDNFELPHPKTYNAV